LKLDAKSFFRSHFGPPDGMTDFDLNRGYDSKKGGGLGGRMGGEEEPAGPESMLPELEKAVRVWFEGERSCGYLVTQHHLRAELFERMYPEKEGWEPSSGWWLNGF